MTSAVNDVRAILHLLLTAMVKDHEAVRINTLSSPQGVTIFRVSVADSDVCKVIGRQGRNIQAIRTIIYSIAKEHRLSVALELRDSRNDGQSLFSTSGVE